MLGDRKTDHALERQAFLKALECAEQAGRLGNVPVGAALIHEGEIISVAANLRHLLNDPSAHAEMLVLREAGQTLKTWRFPKATLVLTMEPCVMCAGAILQARLSRVVYALKEPKYGAHQSMHQLFEGSGTQVEEKQTWGDEVRSVLNPFFESLRS